MEKSCEKCKHQYKGHKKFPCFTCYNYKDFEPMGLDWRKAAFVMLWLLTYVFIIWISFMISGCGTKVNSVSTKPVKWDREVFYYYDTSVYDRPDIMDWQKLRDIY